MPLIVSEPRAVTPVIEPDRLIAYLARLTFEDLPAEVVDAAKASLVDTLSVAHAARDAAGMEAVQLTVLEDGGAPHSRLWGSAHRLPAAAAAFHNSALASALDFDSLHAYTSHADAVVLPAAWAVAERVGASGKQLIAAFVAGVELVYRLGHATRETGGWYRTSVYGAFGAAAAAARLFGDEPRQLSAALGLALCRAAGTQQSQTERTLSKRLLPAFASRVGVEAAQLARRGITAPAHPFDGRFGLFALFDAGDPSELARGLGETFHLTRTTFKKYSACGCTHAAIEAALGLASDHRLDASEIERVDVQVTPYMHRLVGAPFSADGDPEVTGQFCLQYVVAAALARKRFTLADIEPPSVLDAALRPLISRTHVGIDDGNPGMNVPATVVVTTQSGQRLERTIRALPGGAADPLSQDDLRTKALRAFGHGRLGLGGAEALRVVEQLERLETLGDVRDLFTQDLHA